VKEAIATAFEESILAKQVFLQEGLTDLVKAIETIAEAFQRGNKLLLFGNGGSAADAQHLAAEFVNRFRIERPPLPAIALTTDSSALTSIANDYDYSQIFSKQVNALGQTGDVALAISTSGNAVNVLTAIDACRARQIKTIGLSGGNGGAMAGKVDHLLVVRAGRNTARVQETHILIGHVICEMVDELLFSSKS
jgi:D-sedoheptulose 7-phosphate isomerase